MGETSPRFSNSASSTEVLVGFRSSSKKSFHLLTISLVKLSRTQLLTQALLPLPQPNSFHICLWWLRKLQPLPSALPWLLLWETQTRKASFTLVSTSKLLGCCHNRHRWPAVGRPTGWRLHAVLSGCSQLGWDTRRSPDSFPPSPGSKSGPQFLFSSNHCRAIITVYLSSHPNWYTVLIHADMTVGNENLFFKNTADKMMQNTAGCIIAERCWDEMIYLEMQLEKQITEIRNLSSSKTM